MPHDGCLVPALAPNLTATLSFAIASRKAESGVVKLVVIPSCAWPRNSSMRSGTEPAAALPRLKVYADLDRRPSIVAAHADGSLYTAPRRPGYGSPIQFVFQRLVTLVDQPDQCSVHAAIQVTRYVQ
jgi:hypothetical protein